MQLKDLKKKIDGILAGGSAMDPYSAAHLTECQLRITKALDAIYIYNQPQAGGGGMGPIIFGNVIPGSVNGPAVQATAAPQLVSGDAAAQAPSATVQPALEQAVPKIGEGEPKPQ